MVFGDLLFGNTVAVTSYKQKERVSSPHCWWHFLLYLAVGCGISEGCRCYWKHLYIYPYVKLLEKCLHFYPFKYHWPF